MGRSFLLLSLLAACGDKNTDTGAEVAADEGVPEISCTPGSADFGELFVLAGESASQLIACTNVGSADLYITDVTFSGEIAGLITTTAVSSPILPPGGVAQLSVTYTPTADSSDAGAVQIASSDPEQPLLILPLAGEGLAPVLEVSAEAHDFGTVSVGCATSRELELTNTGRDILTIDALSLTTLGDFTLSSDALPISLAPDESAAVTVTYQPASVGSAAINLTVESDDPGAPTSLVALLGEASAPGEQTDTFAEASQPTDVLIAFDASSSQGDEQYGIWTNFDAFISALASRTDDYRVAIIVQDSGVSYGTDYIDASNADDATTIASEMMSVTAGTYTEMGFTILSAGVSANSWLRDSSRLNLVGISDEAEQSANSYSYYVGAFQALRDDPDDVVIHGIGGDYPGGCDTAQAYSGMYEATVATGGAFLSICTTDWAETLTDLADACRVGGDGLSLSEQPVADSIEVTAGGSTLTGWTYREEDNTVLLPADAAEATDIAITYTIQGECD